MMKGLSMGKRLASCRCFAFLLSMGMSEWLLWRHILWRDEAQALMEVARSATLPVLLSHMGYEGTPGLWYFLVWTTRFLPPWWDDKLWTAVITGATLWVLFYMLDLSWPMALLYAGGVQLATYSFMSRSYGLSVLLILLFAHFEKKWREKPSRVIDIWLSIILFLLTQTNVHSTLIAAGIFLYLAGQNLVHRRPVSWLPVIALGVGALAAVLQVWPPPNLGPWDGWHTHDALGRYLIELGLMLPRLVFPFYAQATHSGWANVYGGQWLYGVFQNGNWISKPIALRTVAALAMVVPDVVGIYALYHYVRCGGRKTIPGILAMVVPLLLFAALGAFKYPLELEHLYLLIPYGLALYAVAGPVAKKVDLLAWSLLAMQFLGAVSGIYVAATIPYDITPEIVGWVNSHGYGSYFEKSAVAVFPDPSISVVTLYGNLPDGAYALSAQRFETYTPWDTRELKSTTKMPMPPEHLPGVQGPYLLLTYFPPKLGYNWLDIRLLARFPEGPWIHWQKSPGAFLYMVGQAQR